MTTQRVSLVTLGVSDLGRSRAFYEAWGWVKRQDAQEVVFFQMNGLVLALFPLPMLAEDQGRPDAALGVGAMTLAQNYATQAEVDERFAAALDAGAAELKRPVAAEWGGYSGYVADPDGHVWELAVNPYWDLAEDGSVTIPDHLPES
ncbi:VOC family protein [Demequina sp. NBRC 110056]|uniref:VOC family protein n=1 Tax=Demequina sp. NBRC 110056 TaxID=1570345 RepID=UPI0009FF4CFA|nr:VOC family protein [Demequina sp. NBRC 110056]